LRKQHLTDDTRSENIIQTVRDVGGLHATGPTVPYLSLFSRIRNFTTEFLDEELYVKRSLGKIRYVRKTVYVLPKDMVPAAFAATRSMIVLASEKYSKYLGVTEDEYEVASKRILSVLRGRGMTTKEIEKALGTRLNISPIVNLMCDKGLLMRGNPDKGWKSNIHTYYLSKEYFPDVDLNAYGEEEARRLVVQWYLASFGPATENDVIWWTGFPRGQSKEILEEMRKRVAIVDISDLKGEYFMPSSQKTSLASTSLPENPLVSLLPSLDPYLMGYKDRERYLDPEYYDFIFDRSGNATSTILLDGRVIGIWDFHEPFVKTFLFSDFEETLLEEIRFKARNMGMFVSGKAVYVKECGSMIPLTKRTAGSVMSPLREC